jgi:hypothetical protein
MTPTGFFISGSENRRRSDALVGEIQSVATDRGLQVEPWYDAGNPGSITTAIIEQLAGAEAIFADLTGNNPNVCYEVGVAHALCVPVFLYAESDSKLLFDIADQRVTSVEFDGDELRNKASIRLKTASAMDRTLGRLTSLITPVTIVACVWGWDKLYARPMRELEAASSSQGRPGAFGAYNDPWIELARLQRLLPLTSTSAHAGMRVIDPIEGHGTLTRVVWHGDDVDLDVHFDSDTVISERRHAQQLGLWTHRIAPVDSTARG